MTNSVPHWLADDFDPDRVLGLREQPCFALADERGAIVGDFVGHAPAHREYAELLGRGRSEPSNMLAVAIRTTFAEWAGGEVREAFVFFMTTSIIARISS